MQTFLEQRDAPVNGQHEPTPKTRPSLPRSTSTPSWPKNASMESLRGPRAPPLTHPSTSAPAMLRKRHSEYTLSPASDRPKTPVLGPGAPPKRPLRNPARGAPAKPKARSRPSTATGTREEVTPWEFAPGPPSDEPLRTLGSGTSSPVSHRGRASLITGPVAEVTPWELYPVRRSSLTTALVEEVTPWELHPVPLVMPSRSTLATGPVEEVTPWELAPTPSSAEPPQPMSPISEKRSSPRVSTSSGNSKTLSEIAQIRRQKSTGAKASKSRSNTIPMSSSQSGHPSAIETAHVNKHRSAPAPLPARSNPSTPKLSHRTSARPVVPHIAPSPSPAASNRPLPSPQTSLKFSTADRTILEELKRNIKAREAQFVLKGEGTELGSGLGFRGKKHHTFQKDEVPYPRNYEREVLDLDVWETAFCQDICESLTWHVFDNPPTKVLDIGCGTGTWILNCARAWKNSHFVGVDVVPLQPDLQQVGSSELASRITWVHHNFLDGLPFPDDEFDFVHIKRIALGVPEDKWDPIFEEICRVMKPGGAFEMLEEDLFFPGKLIDRDEDSEPDSASENRPLSHLNSTHSHSDTRAESIADSALLSTSSHTSDGASPLTPTTAAFPTTPSRSNSPVEPFTIEENEHEQEEAKDLLSQVIGDYHIPCKEPATQDDPAIDPATDVSDAVSPPTQRPPLQVKTPHKSRSLVSQPPGFAASAVSLIMSSVGSVAVPPDSLYELEPSLDSKGRVRPRGYSLTSSLPVPDSESRRGHSNSVPTSPHADIQSIPPVPPLLMTVPKPPANPRDHSLLAAIYGKLLESRFINISPLALLTNAMGLHFKDVRTHPPLQYRFPALAQKVRRIAPDAEKEDYFDSEYASDSDDARDAILPSPLPRSMKKRTSRRVSSQSFDELETPISEDNRYIDVRGLIHHASPYITLDETRASALSPSTKSVFPGLSSAKLQSSFLPNTTMHLDLKTLNLHLALRAAEVLACSESMWEWVLDYQAAAKARRANRTTRSYRSGSGSIDLPPRPSITSVSSSKDSTDSFKNSIVELTRDDFDGLLLKFEMDMRDKCALGSALGERFSWSVAESSTSAARKIFNTACEKWDKWELEQSTANRGTSSAPSRHPHRPSSSHRPSSAGQTPQSLFHFSDQTNHDRGYGHEKRKTSASTLTGATLPPTHMMSRAMRVFVAWKP